MQYNIFGRPYAVSHDGQDERLARIPMSLEKLCQNNPKCKALDVITFAEADIAGERTTMLEEFQKVNFKYHTTVLSDTDPFTRYFFLFIWHCYFVLGDFEVFLLVF